MAQVSDAERTEIRQLYEVGTQVHVLEQMYPPDVVKVVVEEVDNERIMADQLKEIERQNEMIEEENKRASMAVPAGGDEAKEEQAENTNNNNNNNNGYDDGAAQEKAMQNLLRAAEEAEAAKAAAEAKMAAEREAARLEEENAAKEAAAKEAAEKEAAEKAAAEKEAAEKARLEAEKEAAEKKRLEEEEEARQKREAEQKAALEKLAQEKEAQERFMQKQKELEEQEKARIEEEAAEKAKNEEEERQKAEAEAAAAAEKARQEAEAAEQARLEEEERIRAEKEAADKAEKEAAEMKAEEESKSGKAERRLTEERLDDEVERLALEMQAELDKFGDDDGDKLHNGDNKAIDDVADQLARDMQRELDKLAGTSKGDDDIEKIDDVADQLAKEMQMEMDKLGLDDDSKRFEDVDSSSALQEGKELIDDVKALLGKGPEEEEEEMEIDFLADLNDDSAPSSKGNNNLAPTSSIRRLVDGKVSQITGSIEKKTNLKPFIKPDEGPMSSKQVSPSVRSKEVRVVPFVCPKSKAQKSADMKNPKTRPADSPGKLDPKLKEQQVMGIAVPIAPLPRVAKLSPTRIKARELKPTTPRSKSPRPAPGRLKHGWSPSKSPNTPSSPPVALPRVATLASPARPTYESPQGSLPPKITAPPIIPPRSNTQIKHTFPRVLSPRDGPMCPTPYDPELHGSKGACERCMELASEEEKEKFAITGHHLRIMIVSGGCGKGCLVFPRGEDDIPVRLCKKCYFDTHRTYYDALESHPPPVDR